MKNAVITVFGGTGFVGRYVVQRLAETGATIKVATRNRQSAYFLRPCGKVGQVVPICCDVRNDKSVAAAVAGSTHVINLIGILAEKGGNTFLRMHVDVPERIARACKKSGVRRLVHVSAIGADRGAESKYARSKALGEEAVQKTFPDATILRPSVIFGPEDDFFNRFAGLARISPFLPLIGGGYTKFQPVYVADVADAVANALYCSEAPGHIYELGGPHVYSFRQLMYKMMEVTGQKRLLLGVPWWVAKILGYFMNWDYKLGIVSRPVLTVDQVRSLKVDNVVRRARTFKDLGIAPTAMDSILPTYLTRYRRGGRFSKKQAA